MEAIELVGKDYGELEIGFAYVVFVGHQSEGTKRRKPSEVGHFSIL